MSRARLVSCSEPKSWSSSPADLCAAAASRALRTEEPADDLVLPLAAQFDKRLAGLPPAERFELSQAEAIHLLQRDAEAGNGAIDVVDDAGVRRADVAVSARNDALRDRFDSARLEVVEEDEGD